MKKLGKKKYTSIKILTEHYELVKTNKDKTGVNMDFFIGQAVSEKLIGITGWAIDIGKCTTKEMKEFLRLWEKIKPIPLHRNKNTNK